MTRAAPPDGPTCPVPLPTGDTILLGHGGGGRLTTQLVASVFLPAFANDTLLALEDQANVALDPRGGTLAITTDSFVVRPTFFPGGDIGRLAVCGTVNDLVAVGARPRVLTAAFVLEEGLPIADLRRIAESMRVACVEAGVTIVAGDTKVVDRGKADRVFITTTGVGVVPPERAALSASAVREGDVVIVSGTLGDHGVAVLSVREGLALETDVVSDVAPLGGLVEALFAAGVTVRAMRDPTRGGVACTLHELAERSKVGFEIDERALPIRPAVSAACELLGLDPLAIANEGKLVVVVAAPDADRALAALRAQPRGEDAAIIGRAVRSESAASQVRLRTTASGTRIVPLPSGEQLPRIC